MPTFRTAAPAPEKTIADRFGEAAALRDYALDVFRKAADDLETSVRLHEEIAVEAKQVANEHDIIAGSAWAQAAAAQKQADRIRELIAA